MSKDLEQGLTAEQLPEQLKWNEQGLVATIVQDAKTLEVLTLAYVNQESLQRSIESGETWFWSRSRQELWHKGATSGNVQKIVSLKYDCDGDALVVLVEPAGPACHTGEVSCFTSAVDLPKAAQPPVTAAGRFDVLAELEAVIAEREVSRPEGAYTTYLFEKGVDKILKKVGEETAETIIAAKNKDNDELRLEVSDLLYHLLVLLQERKLPLDDIMSELNRRHERPRRD
ncbi:bifunctional phosphoribosyl-AMP cyclohydrolase/phosphoribosyl-ATP diphosphatase HisIE [Paenibacillus sp. JX-17]|uniref:Histidine biosynthesis bifunctional protein HisIE n=1 Tax=Paenibacillus lacisoli TaxID=3064525 RepID=A0ABT9CGU2_9BACL|nr:bifunctional phosphoribosyl-AMP cyclohydrolase/phosphoribosyl-ATP diphosphatase HisIE [Paenibacillus sp. JX-17]MDO7908508.1 bifunctional phosphoribosyl-AMP cyclohydrolase/phosphoribosyl-ATP diphosphatase HisIE [Paenibacillus sp. JX-17]